MKFPQVHKQWAHLEPGVIPMTQYEEKLLEILEREAVEFNEHHYEGLCRIAQAINNLADAVKETEQ